MTEREQGLGEDQADWRARQTSAAGGPPGDDDTLEKLRKAVVDSASDARRAFVIFAAFSIYLAITVGSTTHEQLLIGTVFRLPILSVSIPILGFYVILPLLYLIAHFNLLGELNTLSDDAYRLKRHLRDTGQRLQAPIPFGLARTLVQPDDTGLPRGLLYGLSFLVIVLVPPFILLQIQLRFLPYHEQSVTWLHRGMILFDVLLITSLWFSFRHEGLRNGAFAPREGRSVVHAGLDWARRTTGKVRWAYRHTADGIVCTVIFAILLGFSFFVATVPRSWMEDKAIAYLGWLGTTEIGRDRYTTSYLGHRSEADRRMLTLTFILFEHPESWRWIRRNLIVSHSDLVMRRPPDDLMTIYGRNMDRLKDIWDQGVRGIDLRGRDLRFADFSNSDLRKADLRGADLEGAIFSSANLQFANLGDIEYAKVGGCPSHDWFHDTWKRIANKDVRFCRTNLKSVNLRGADLRGTDFWETDLRAANISWAKLQSAGFYHTHLDGADMKGAMLTDARTSHQDECSAMWRGARFKEKAEDGTDEANIRYKNMLRTTCILFFDF